MMTKINCKQNDRGAWCKDKRIKRSLLGLGARCCVLYPNWTGCEYQEKYPKPVAPPPPPQKV